MGCRDPMAEGLAAHPGLADLPWVSGKMTATYSTTKSGSTLTVSNGTNSINLNLAPASYSSWLLSQDSGTGTLVADPVVTGSLSPDANGRPGTAIDLSEIGFGANTTLAYSANSANTGGTLTVSDASHAQSIALLGLIDRARHPPVSRVLGGRNGQRH